MAAHRFALALLLVVSTGCTDDTPASGPTPHPYVTTVGAGDPLRVRVPTDRPTTVEIPAGWSYVTTPGFGHFVAMAAATRAELLENVREDAHGALSRYRGIPPGELTPTDAFVELQAAYAPLTGRDTPFTEDLRPSDFSVERRILGRPVFIYGGEGDDGGHYAVRYWTGPDADPDTVADALALVISIDA